MDQRGSVPDRTIAPREIVFHLTHRCPLKCSHCFASSGPQASATLDLADILRAIEEAARLETVGWIAFSGGGEPFLAGDALRQAIHQATRLGFATEAVTSAYWATSPERALQTLQPYVEAGLKRLTISYDDPHAEFVAERNILYAVQAARHLKVYTKIAVVREPGAKITGAYMAERLGIPLAGDELAEIYETAINSVGRALENTGEDELRARRRQELVYRGPCLSMLRQPSVTPGGKILPCCGVVTPLPGLTIGNLETDSLAEVVPRAYENLVNQWIAFEGPVALLCQITAGTDSPLKEEDFDGICNACEVLFSSSEYQELLREALPAKRASLQLQAELYSALGWYQPPGRAGKECAR